MDISPVGNVVIPITMTDGTATAGEDYTALPTAVTFTAGATGDDLIQIISIPVLDDNLDENEETFTVAFGTLPTGVYAGARNTVSMMLVDDDIPELSVSASSLAVDEGETITITITADIAPVVDLSVPYTISGTGITSADYTLTGATGAAVLLPAGQKSAALMLTVTDDADAAETLTLTLSSGIDHLVSASAGALSVTINPTATPTIAFTSGAVTVHEGAGTVAVTVQLSISPSVPITVPVRTTNGTATSGADYTALTTTNAVFASGAIGAGLMQTVSIPIADDDLDELDETFTVDFGALPDSVSAGTLAAVTVTITDDDVPAVSFTAETASVSEGAGTATVTVQLSTSPSGQITIPVMTTDGVALADEDYTALAQDIVYAAGASGADLMQTISIPITDDGLDESHEPFTVAFGTLPDSVSAGMPAAVTITITDDDVPAVSFVEETVSVREDAGSVTVTVQLNTPPVVSVFIPVLTADGTATATEDYEPRWPRITPQGAPIVDLFFAAGASGADLTQTVSIPIIDDNLDENDETFTVNFGTLLAGSVSAGTQAAVTVTITETDADLPEYRCRPLRFPSMRAKRVRSRSRSRRVCR